MDQVQRELKRWTWSVHPSGAKLLLLWSGGATFAALRSRMFCPNGNHREFSARAKVKPSNGNKELKAFASSPPPQHWLASLQAHPSGTGALSFCLVSTESPSGLRDGFQEPEERRPSQIHRPGNQTSHRPEPGPSTLLLDESFEMIGRVILLSRSGHATSTTSGRLRRLGVTASPPG